MLRSSAFGLSLLAGSIAAQGAHNEYSRHLKFRADGTFKILTFSDLALSDNSEDYLQTQSLIENVLNSENPDLVVLTGDVVHPDYADDYTYHFTSALELIKARQVPWVWTGGNHIKQLSRYDLHEVDYGYGMNLSWTGYFWDQHQESPRGKVYDQEKMGYFTARIPIMDATGQDELLSVYTIDTSADYCQEYGLPGESCITTNAVDWFADQQALYSHDQDLRDLVFMHKPIPEFMNAANLYTISGHKQQAIGCHAVNSGFFSAALESKKTVWINAGFDNDNDFSTRYHGEMMLSYARKSGYGGEGTLPRGVRAFRLSQQADGVLHGFSYVVEGDNGQVSTDMPKRSPPNFGFSLQTQCSVDPFATMFETVINPEFIE